MPATAVSPIVVARLAAAATQDVPGVTGLHGGAVGEMATYGDGERVGGVVVRPATVRPATSDPYRLRLHIVVDLGRPVPHVAGDVRAAVTTALERSGLGVDVIDIHVVDIDSPDTSHP